MKKLVLSCVTVPLLTGCLSTPPDPVVAVPTPVCKSLDQCGVMWRAAQDWVSHVARMQVAHVSPDLIETFPALMTDKTTLTGTVTKRALEDGSQVISAKFSCGDTQFPCARLERSGTNLFNAMVTAAGEGQ
jgi:hypothetical protein